MLVIPAGSEVSARDVQSWKAEMPMLVIPAGSEISARDVQS